MKFYTKMNSRTIFACFLILLVVSCQRDNSGKTEHPTDENLLKDEEASFVITNDSESQNRQLMQIAEKFRNSELMLRLGGEENVQENILGNIVDASFAGNYLYLLDYQKMNVSIYNISGEYISTMARGGRGPGELTEPETILIHNEYLYILNNHYGVQVFKKNPESDEYEPFETDRTESHIWP